MKKLFITTLSLILLFGFGLIAFSQDLGSYLDPFLSIQVGTNPATDEVLKTDGTDSEWVDISTLTGGLNNWTINANGDLTPTTTIDVLLPANVTTTGSTYLGTSAGLSSEYINNWSDIGNNILSGFTDGSVLHVGSADDFVEDNTSFYWDRTEQRLGIGNNAPQSPLEVTGTSTFDIINADSHRVINVSDPVLSGDAINKSYFDANAIGGLSWQEAVINILDFTTSEPAGPTVGDRYITNATGTMSVTGQYGYNQFIYTWATTNWATTTPTNQMALKNTTDGKFYTFSQADWNWNSLGSAFNHNSLLGLQGGASSEYYHLTFNEHENIFIKGVDDTDDLNEGSSNLFYTDGRVDTRVTGQDYTVTGDWNFTDSVSVATPVDDLDAVNLETMNLYLSGLSWQEPVDDKDLSTPPGAPTLGDRYIVAGSASGWYDTSWSNRQQIDLAFADVDSAMTDYPALVKLTDNGNTVFTTSLANGNDILFTDEDGNKLKHEIEEYDTSGKVLLAWVKIPYLHSTSTTEIYMYYGNGASGNQQEVADTWDSDYEMVYHLDDASGNADDSTGVYDGTNTSISYSATGKIGDAYDFNGSTSYTDTSYTTSLSANDFTIEGWLQADSTGEVYAIAQAHTAPSYSSDFIYYYNGSTNLWWMRSKQLAQPGGFDGTNWNYIVMAWDESAGTYEGFVNGVSAGTSATVTGYGGVNSIKIGTRGDAVSSFWEGIIDEVKISSTLRSDDYISTTYNIQSDPANFVTFGSEESITASGDWAGHINSIMEWDGINWNHATSSVGWATIVLDEDLQYTFDGSNWVISSGSVSAHNDTTGKQGGDGTNYYHWGLTLYNEIVDWLGSVVLGSNGDMNLGSGDITTTGDIDGKDIEASNIIRGNMVVADGTGSHPTIAGGYIELYVLPGSPTGRILPYTGSSYIDLAIGDWNGGDPNIMLKTGGKVGINEGSPETKLHVNGDGYFKGASDTEQLTVRGHSTQNDDILVVEKSDGTDLFTIDNSGNSTTTGQITMGNDSNYLRSYLIPGVNVPVLDGKSALAGDAVAFMNAEYIIERAIPTSANPTLTFLNSTFGDNASITYVTTTDAMALTGADGGWLSTDSFGLFATDPSLGRQFSIGGTAYTGSAGATFGDVTRTANSIATDDVVYGTWHNYLVASTTWSGSPVGKTLSNKTFGNSLDRVGTVNGYGTSDGEQNFANRSWVTAYATYNGTEDYTVQNFSYSAIVRDTSEFDSAGDTLTLKDYALHIDSISSPVETAGTITGTNTGLHIDNITSNLATITNGSIDTYGIKIDTVTGHATGDTYGIWDNSGAGWYNSGDATTTGSTYLGTTAGLSGEYINTWSDIGTIIGTGNPFNQWLDSTSSPTFANLTTSNINNSGTATTDSLYVGGIASLATTTMSIDSKIQDTDASYGYEFATTNFNDDLYGFGVGEISLLKFFNSSGLFPNGVGAISQALSIVDDDDYPTTFPSISFADDDIYELAVNGKSANITYNTTTDALAFTGVTGGYSFDDEIAITGTATSTFAGNVSIADGKDLQVSTIYSYSPLNINSDLQVNGNATTTGQQISGFGSKIGSNPSGRYFLFEEVSLGALGTVPFINPEGSSGGAIPTGSAGLYGSLNLLENDDDGSVANGTPKINFLAGDVATTFNLATINFATTTDSMDFSGASTYTFDAPVHTTMLRQDGTWHAYGGFQGQTETINLASAGVWATTTNATNDLWTGDESDGITLTNDIMTFVNAGDYIGSISLSFEGGLGKNYAARIYSITNETATRYVPVSGNGNNNYMPLPVAIYLEVEAGEQFIFQVVNLNDGTDIEVRDATFYITYLHD